MTKREQLRQLHSTLYKFIEKEYPDADLFDEGQCMDINLFGEGNDDDFISFHKSRLTIDYFDWVSDKTKDAIKNIESKFDWINK